MSITNDYFICNMNLIGYENKFEEIISNDKTPIYYFYGSKNIGKKFFTQHFSKFYLKRTNYYLIHLNNTLDNFYFNCFAELILNEKFQDIYMNKINKYIDNNSSYEDDFIDLRFTKTKPEFIDYLNKNSLMFFKDFIDIERKRGFLIVIENIDEYILNSNFIEKLQKIYDKFNSMIPITFIITSEWDALNKFKEKTSIKNIIYNEIKPLSDNEVKNFLINTFEEMHCLIDEEIIDNIIYLSNGYLDIIRILGSACYNYVWRNNDYTIKNDYYWRNIRKENFYKGLFKYITCPEIIGNYFALKENLDVLKKYLPILNKIFTEFKLNYDSPFYFNSKEFFNKLSEHEKSVHNDCLSYLIKNQVVSCINLEKNVYRMDNVIFLIYSKIIWEYFLETHYNI